MVRATLHEQEIRQVVGVPGAGDLVVEGLVPLDDARDRCLYFVNRPLTDAVRASLAVRSGCIVIVAAGSAPIGGLGSCRVLEVADPRAAIARVLAFIRAEGRQPPWVEGREIAPGAVLSPLAVVEGNVRIGEGAVIEPFCTVGPDVVIGPGSILRSGARVHPRVSIGEASVIGANTVLGYEGYGFVRGHDGNKTRIPHLAGVVIGSHVEIGALAVIQGGALRPTTIEDHAKIDDNVEIGHGARVGRGVSIVGGSAIGGSAIIEAEAWIGINATVRDGRRVGSRALVGMDASVQDDLPDDAIARAPRPEVVSRPGDDDRAIGFARRPPRPRSA
jgi:UDP-3-O-[3-hydroxymyristoyl] glucosamine N-acyltransferase LpxD